MTEREEADTVIDHMGWRKAWDHLCALVKIVFSADSVNYHISVDPECGHYIRSTLVIDPTGPRALDRETRREHDRIVFGWLRAVDKDLYMMTVISAPTRAAGEGE